MAEEYTQHDRFSWAVKVVKAHFENSIVTGHELDDGCRYEIAIASRILAPRHITVRRQDRRHKFDLNEHHDPMTKLLELIEGVKSADDQ